MKYFTHSDVGGGESASEKQTAASLPKKPQETRYHGEFILVQDLTLSFANPESFSLLFIYLFACLFVSVLFWFPLFLLSANQSKICLLGADSN